MNTMIGFNTVVVIFGFLVSTSNAIASEGLTSAYPFTTKSNNKGRLLILDEKSNHNEKKKFFVKSCTAETVVLAEQEGREGAFIFEPGDILVYIGVGDNDNDDHNTSSVCTKDCSRLFRKIVSQDGQILRTMMASFREVFPSSIINNELSDIVLDPDQFIESQLLQCPDSLKMSNDVHHHPHRSLSDYYEDPYGDNSPLCTIGILSVSLLFFSFLIVTCFFCSICAIPIIFITGGLFGLAGCNTFSALFPGGGFFGYDESGGTDNTERRLRTLIDNENNNIKDSSLKFPKNHRDWMSKDANSNCIYFDCRSDALSGIGEDCLHDTQDFLSCKTNKYIDGLTSVDKLIALQKAPTTKTTSVTTGSSAMNNYNNINNSVTNDATCLLDYCYASKFSKQICDIKYYHSLRASCEIIEGTKPLLDNKVVGFPLTTTAVAQNCQLMSILLYLAVGAGNSRNERYEIEQSLQKDYEKNVCSAME